MIYYVLLLAVICWTLSWFNTSGIKDLKKLMHISYVHSYLIKKPEIFSFPFTFFVRGSTMTGLRCYVKQTIETSNLMPVQKKKCNLICRVIWKFSAIKQRNNNFFFSCILFYTIVITHKSIIIAQNLSDFLKSFSQKNNNQ